jgi:DNA-binding CsgD family transcriptional regulator
MVMKWPGARLLGRRHECAQLDRLLEAVRSGHGGALVVAGEPGIGKTTLLEYAIESASGLRVARAVGIESEMELPFAALHQLCASMLDRLDRLPPPQSGALGVAFGLTSGETPDRFLVGLAVLTLFSEVAEGEPLLCVVDDSQWLDRASAQALAFVARRLLADPVGLVFGTREVGVDLRGLPELVVEDLATGDARALLSSVLRVRLDDRVRDRIVAETHGNPLALLEWTRGLTPSELVGAFGLPRGRPLSGQIEEGFRRQLAQLPAATQRLLFVAAADAVGDPLLVWRAAARLGIGAEAAPAAVEAALIEFGTRVSFRHPLVRSAIYGTAPLAERQKAHQALAEATDPEADPDRRAWHRAQAAVGPDEEVASELERSAARAQRRGGLAAAAAFLERSAALTLDPARRAERTLGAALAQQQAGASDAALTLLVAAEKGPLNELQSAEVDLLRGQIAFASGNGSDAPALLVKAAQRLAPLDLSLARETYRDAFYAAVTAGRLAVGGGMQEVAEAVRAVPPAPPPLDPPGLLLDGLALLITDGYGAGVPVLRRALSGFCDERLSTLEKLRWLPLACRAAAEGLWDYETWAVLSSRLVELARDAGALTILRYSLSMISTIHVISGDFASAASIADEADAVSQATGAARRPYGALLLSAWRGREADVDRLTRNVTKEMLDRGEGQWLTATEWADAVLYNALSRYDEALVAAEKAYEHGPVLGLSLWALVELIEAAARSGRPERASRAFARLLETTRASGTDWALGIEARSRALMSGAEAAEVLYREAIDRLERTRLRAHVARGYLVYGEWLRRERRRLEAREQLRTAYEMFDAMGAGAFAERARIELNATGEHARQRTVETANDLTPQEAQICRMAANGRTNAEIAAGLFISASTVDYHLRKAFRKLGVKSRTQLADHMSQ